MIVDIHADDYGYSINTSKDILECMKKGCLDSISIICNTNAFEESMKMLYDAIPSLPFLPLISVHINFSEGFFINKKLPLIWTKLFIRSYLPSNKNINLVLQEEIKSQIDIVNEVTENCIEIAKMYNIKTNQKGLRIDSHTHTHLVPIVWKNLVKVIEKEKYNIEYIRNPKEPIIPFIKHSKLVFTYKIINIIKNRILMFYSKKVDKYHKDHDIDKMYMWGLIMSGHMDFDRIKEIYPSIYDYAKKHNRNLEILLHPGMALKEEIGKEINMDYFNNFNGNKERLIEKDAVLRIKEIVR